uniref:Putative secreted protein n=1 Tax=Ixodes ricinus TaxID=34613 RepID=A0A147BM60_IXORI
MHLRAAASSALQPASWTTTRSAASASCLAACAALQCCSVTFWSTSRLAAAFTKQSMRLLTTLSQMISRTSAVLLSR